MARIDTLRLLLTAEIPDDVPTLEASMVEITRRLDELDPESDAYAAAHARLDTLLAARRQIVQHATD